MPPKRTTRLLELTVGSKYILPEFFERAEPSEVEQALTLGALVCETVVSAKASAEIKDIITKKQAEVDTLRQRFTEQMTEIQTQTAEKIRLTDIKKDEEIAFIKSMTSKKIAEIQAEMTTATEERETLIAKHTRELKDLREYQQAEEGKIRVTEREHVTQQMNQRIQQLQTEIHIQAERNAGLLERKNQLEATRDADIRHAEERALALLKPAMAEKDQRIAAAQETIRSHNEAYANLADTLTRLTESVTRRSANAKLKGSKFEGDLRALLTQYYGTNERFKLVDSAASGIGHEGDIIMHWNEEQILWEGKNYDYPVPTAEVVKFRNDMRDNPMIRVGVMISDHSPITGMTERGDMKTEFMNGQMHVYISNFHNFSPSLLSLLLELFHVHWNSESITEKDESKESAIRNIAELHNTSQRIKKEWRLQQSRMREGMQFMADTVDTFEDAIQRILTNLQAGAVTKCHEVPSTMFRPTHGDEKLEQTIQIILDLTSIREGASIALNDLADLLSKRKTLSRDTARTHIKAVLQDSVFETVKGKPTILRGLELRGEDVLSHVRGGSSPLSNPLS